MEIVGLVILGIGVLEGLVLCIEMHKRNNLLKWNNSLIHVLEEAQKLGKEQELDKNPRRNVEGTFSNPLQDGYRKNKKGQYVPIKPNNNPYAIRPHIGDEEDEV